MTPADRIQQIRELLAGYPRSIGGVTRPAADLEEEFYDASTWLIERVEQLEAALREIRVRERGTENHAGVVEELHRKALHRIEYLEKALRACVEAVPACFQYGSAGASLVGDIARKALESDVRANSPEPPAGEKL